MTRTERQQMGDHHEADIAEWIGGVQHKASGSQWHRQMDASNGERLVPFPLAADGKSTLGKGITVTREMWKKAVEQTFGKIPTLWLRFYRDESLREVSIDLVVIERRDFREILEAARNWERHVRHVKSIGLDNPPQGPEELVQEVLKHQGPHQYTSTACQHARKGMGAEYLHARCRETCKFCGVRCDCRCHNEHPTGCDCCR